MRGKRGAIDMWDRSLVDYADGLERFSGNEMLYREFLVKFLSDDSFCKLSRAMKEDDREGAYRASHALRGDTGNLSLRLVYEKLLPLVESLRAGDGAESALPLFYEAEAAYSMTILHIKENITA